MHIPVEYHSRTAFEPPWDASVVLAHARTLALAFRAGATQGLLRGKNFGLLCEADDTGDAALFRRAVVEMGAQVAHLRPSLSKLGAPQELQHTARMLGRLYDAVACQGMAPALVQQLGVYAGVPVFDDVASADHPTARLAERLGGDASPADNRRFVLQAVLLSKLL